MLQTKLDSIQESLRVPCAVYLKTEYGLINHYFHPRLIVVEFSEVQSNELQHDHPHSEQISLVDVILCLVLQFPHGC